MIDLNFSEMPRSLAAQSLLWVASSNYLNPPNRGQSGLSRYLGKPLRAAARALYQVAVAILAPFGVAYHLLMGGHYQIASLTAKGARVRFLAKEHLKAALLDLWAPIRALPFFYNPKGPIAALASSSLVRSAPFEASAEKQLLKWALRQRAPGLMRPLPELKSLAKTIRSAPGLQSRRLRLKSLQQQELVRILAGKKLGNGPLQQPIITALVRRLIQWNRLGQFAMRVMIERQQRLPNSLHHLMQERLAKQADRKVTRCQQLQQRSAYQLMRQLLHSIGRSAAPRSSGSVSRHLVQELWRQRLSHTLYLPYRSRELGGIDLFNHPLHARQMRRGFYRFDQLLLRALEVKQTLSEMPPLDHPKVHLACYLASCEGCYAS